MKDPGVTPMGEQVKDPQLHPRIWRLMARDVAAHGYTPGCRKCALAERFGWERATGDHSRECRGRIEAALMNTPEGMLRMQKVIERLDKAKDAAPEAGKSSTAVEEFNPDLVLPATPDLLQPNEIPDFLDMPVDPEHLRSAPPPAHVPAAEVSRAPGTPDFFPEYQAEAEAEDEGTLPSR